mmetsp:Transcript_16535/g.28099  ORF Transcript_16535/g.28099 Transcript_16535/m.28099 type:complete len:122 (-) Transcript_16535:142-507(-)
MIFMDMPELIVSVHSHDNSTTSSQTASRVELYRPYQETAPEEDLFISLLQSNLVQNLARTNCSSQVMKTFDQQRLSCGASTLNSLVSFNPLLPGQTQGINCDGVHISLDSQMLQLDQKLEY